MSLKDKYVCASDVVSATINNGTSISDAIDLGGLRLFGLIIPMIWTAAEVSFQASFQGKDSFYDLHDKDGEICFSVTAGSYLELEAEKFASIQTIKIRSGVLDTPIPQEASADIGLVLRAI